MEIQKEETKPILKTSQFRSLDIGKNYLNMMNPRRKKFIIQILDSYIENIKSNQNDNDTIVDALDIFYLNQYRSRNLNDMLEKELDFSDYLLWHLYSLMNFDRLASAYTRFEFLQYYEIIKDLNSKEKRNKLKLVFTSHPTQPNSMEQLIAISNILKG